MTKAGKLRVVQHDAQLRSLQQEHLSVDEEINRLMRFNNPIDATFLRDLKKKRLELKQQIEKLGGTTLTNGKRKPPKGAKLRLVPVGYRPGA